LSTAA